MKSDCPLQVNIVPFKSTEFGKTKVTLMKDSVKLTRNRAADVPKAIAFSSREASRLL